MAELISRMHICHHHSWGLQVIGNPEEASNRRWPAHLSTLLTFCIWQLHVGLSYLILSFISCSPFHFFSPLLLGLLKLTQGHFNLAFWPWASESYTAEVNGASASTSISLCMCVHVCAKCAWSVCVYKCLCSGWYLLGYIGLGGWRQNKSQKSNAFCLSCE